jgi:hypothetical protein
LPWMEDLRHSAVFKDIRTAQAYLHAFNKEGTSMRPARAEATPQVFHPCALLPHRSALPGLGLQNPSISISSSLILGDPMCQANTCKQKKMLSEKSIHGMMSTWS